MTLFKNATIITMNPEAPVLYNTDLAVVNGKLAYTTDVKPGRVLDCTNKLIMPGLYNCHSHAGMVMFRGYGSDCSLEDWLHKFIFPAERRWTPALLKAATLLACAEMISSGTVAFTDMYFFMDKIAEAVGEAGMLANISNGIIGFDADSYDFYKDNVYEQTIRAIEQYHSDVDSKIKIDASIHGVYTSHPRAWQQVMDFAHKHGLRLHVHLSETRTEYGNSIVKYGKSPTARFYEAGVFDLPCLAAHGVILSDEDLAMLAEKQVDIAHCPLSNLKLASGIANVTEMLKAGINVALGTDGASSNNSLNMFMEMKMASLLQKNSHADPTALPAYEALKLATLNGARAQGRAGESGQLIEGFDADLIVLDMGNCRQIACHDPVQNVVYSASGSDVYLTMCRGRVLYEKGEFFTIDIEEVLFEAKKAAFELLP